MYDLLQNFDRNHPSVVHKMKTFKDPLPKLEPYTLPGLNVDPNMVTVAGMSSGSYFSCYILAANSNIIKGAGCLNGSLYTTTFRGKIKLNEKEPKVKSIIRKYVYEAR